MGPKDASEDGGNSNNADINKQNEVNHTDNDMSTNVTTSVVATSVAMFFSADENTNHTAGTFASTAKILTR